MHDVTIIVDGQYGSCGKGLLAQWVAHNKPLPDFFVSTASAQAGHTFYKNGQKHVCFHLSVGGASTKSPQMLSGGCIIDLECLKREVDEFYGGDWSYVKVHPSAAIITEEDARIDAENTRGISGTGKGVGEAMARKIRRKDPNVAKDNEFLNDMGAVISFDEWVTTVNKADLVLEIPQGLSLGINGPFYPYCTSRECTVMQGLSDAQINPETAYIDTYMAVRTFPIRVGSLPNSSSGDCYPDQEETSWEAIGVDPEVTTVTGRVRRVFTFSWQQLEHGFLLNSPDHLFVNFMNYLHGEEHDEFMKAVAKVAYKHGMANVMFGYGPEISDVVTKTVGSILGDDRFQC